MILAAILSAIAVAFGGFKASQMIRKESTAVPKYFEDEVLELGIQPHIVRKNKPQPVVPSNRASIYSAI